MMMVACVTFGVLSFGKLGVDQFPDVEIPVVTVTTTLRGASPEEIETQVTKLIEDAVVYPFDVSTIPFPSWGAFSAVVGDPWVVLYARDADSGPSLRWTGPDGEEYFFASATGLSLTHTLQATTGTAIS